MARVSLLVPFDVVQELNECLRHPSGSSAGPAGPGSSGGGALPRAAGFLRRSQNRKSPAALTSVDKHVESKGSGIEMGRLDGRRSGISSTTGTPEDLDAEDPVEATPKTSSLQATEDPYVSGGAIECRNSIQSDQLDFARRSLE